MVFAQIVTGGIDPTSGLTIAFVGAAFATAAGIYQRFLTANVKAESDRLAAAVANYREDYKRLEQKLWVTQQQLEQAGREAAMWRARSESSGWVDNRKSSPPSSDPA